MRARQAQPKSKSGELPCPTTMALLHTISISNSDVGSQRPSPSVLAARFASELCETKPSENERAQGRPGVGLAHGPPANKKQAAVTTGLAETPGLPCAAGLRLTPRSPRGPAVLPPSLAIRRCELGISTGMPGPHGLTVRTTIVRRPSKKAAIACGLPLPASTFVTIAMRPSARGEMRYTSTTSGKAKVEYFSREIWTGVIALSQRAKSAFRRNALQAPRQLWQGPQSIALVEVGSLRAFRVHAAASPPGVFNGSHAGARSRLHCA